MRDDEQAIARAEGLDPDRYRPLRAALHSVSGPHKLGGPAETTAGAALKLARDLRQVGKHSSDSRARARNGVRWVRLGWLAHCCERGDLARYAFARAEADFLRASHAVVAVAAGNAWIAATVRARKGREAHRGATASTEEAIRAARAKYPNASYRELARRTGISERTIRRVLGKPPPKVAA